MAATMASCSAKLECARAGRIELRMTVFHATARRTAFRWSNSDSNRTLSVASASALWKLSSCASYSSHVGASARSQLSFSWRTASRRMQRGFAGDRGLKRQTGAHKLHRRDLRLRIARLPGPASPAGRDKRAFANMPPNGAFMLKCRAPCAAGRVSRQAARSIRVRIQGGPRACTRLLDEGSKLGDNLSASTDTAFINMN